MLSVVCFKWSKRGYRSAFNHEHVNTLQRMVARHYPDPHRFICVTDDPVGLDPSIDVISLWAEGADVPNPTWENGPSCFRRLRVFSRWFQEKVGERFVVLDLDMVITGDVRALWNREDDFLIWRPNHASITVCASMIMVKAGTNRHVWDTFDVLVSPQLSAKAGFKGSDQGWLGYCFGRDAPGWTSADGVYGYKDDLCRQVRPNRRGNISIPPRLAAQRKKLNAGGDFGALPGDAKMVIFTGKPDPWDSEAINASPWIKEHYW